MLWNLVATALVVLAVILLLHPRVQGMFRRFDLRNRTRIAAEHQDRRDHLAHFRHTMTLAEEQVEQVQPITVPDERTGTPVTRYLFEGETFANESDAKLVREAKMRAIALGFYKDLPAALRARREDDKLKSN
jgi:hypothetical protein